jgi:hypothetical protein
MSLRVVEEGTELFEADPLDGIAAASLWWRKVELLSDLSKDMLGLVVVFYSRLPQEPCYLLY